MTSYFTIPLTFPPQAQPEQVSTVRIGNSSYAFRFQQNSISNELLLSVYDNVNVYFGSLRCVSGYYMNPIDNGFPYLVYFVQNITGDPAITFENLTNGNVTMWLRTRGS